jgi:hypothetical protein
MVIPRRIDRRWPLLLALPLPPTGTAPTRDEDQYGMVLPKENRSDRNEESVAALRLENGIAVVRVDSKEDPE